MNVERIPSIEDWGSLAGDQDLKFAFENYGGRSNDQMRDRYRSAPLEVCSELAAMPKRPFCYYIKGFMQAVMTKEFSEDNLPNAASCFLRLIHDKLKSGPADFEGIMDEVVEVVNFIASHQKEYDADLDIFGDFQDMKVEIDRAVSVSGL